MKKAIIILLVIAAAALVILGGMWYWRESLFSNGAMRVEILGPDSAKAGDQVTYTVKYKNNGNFPLQDVKLVFNLPDHSITEDDKTYFSRDLSDLAPGDEGVVTFSATLLGKEGDVASAHAAISYMPKNLSARYESQANLATVIAAVPITLTYDMPSKAEKGKQVSYTINYFSSIDYPLENLSVKVDPVPGFNIVSADPLSLDNVEWKLNTLQKAQGGRITISGVVTGDSGSTVPFSCKLGMWQHGTFVVIKEARQDLEVISPPLIISEEVNGASDYIATPGETLHYKILLRNAGATAMDNLTVTSKLQSSGFDLSTVRSDQGQPGSGKNIIVFDAARVLDLAHLDPGGQASVSFDVTLKTTWAPLESDRNHGTVANEVSVFDTDSQFSFKVNTNASALQRVSYQDQSGIDSSGPIPPKADQVTTYTVQWQVQNPLNDLKNVTLKAVLPEGVVLTGRVLPESQSSSFSLDSKSRQVVWAVGDLPASADPGPSLYFQISYSPGFSQTGLAGQLIGQATLSGEDQFTGKTISVTAPAVTTALPDDPSHGGSVGS
jgi:uncharacterized repeat protein (TIGR01451 family)